jgi:hypothetical protein
MKPKFFILFFLLSLLAGSCARDYDMTEILKLYGDVRDDMGYSIAAGEDGYYICGQLTEVLRVNGNHITGSEPKIGLVKTDIDGNLVWKKFLGGKFPGTGSKVIVLADGSVVCAGQVTDTISLTTDIWVEKLDENGASLGSPKLIVLDGNQTSVDILKTASGFLLLGTTDSETSYRADSVFNIGGYSDILLVSLLDNLEISGNPLQWGYPWNDRGVALKSDRNGGYIIAGTTDRYANIGMKNDVFLLKINEAGSLREPKIFTNKTNESASDMEVIDDGYLVAGTAGTESELQRPWFGLVPFNIQDTIYYPAPYENIISWSVNSIARYRNNFFVAAGRYGSPASSEMLFFVVDKWGNIVDGRQMITGSIGIQVANDVISDAGDYVIAAGRNSNEINSMMSFFKFRF